MGAAKLSPGDLVLLLVLLLLLLLLPQLLSGVTDANVAIPAAASVPVNVK
jgi:hypothetical protein